MKNILFVMVLLLAAWKLLPLEDEVEDMFARLTLLLSVAYFIGDAVASHFENKSMKKPAAAGWLFFPGIVVAVLFAAFVLLSTPFTLFG